MGGGRNLGLDKLVEDKYVEMERAARRKCQIRITGLQEEEREDPLSLRRKVEEVIEGKMKVVGGGRMVVDVFRVGRKGEDKWGRPRVVLARVASEWQRRQVLMAKPNLRGCKDLGVDMDRTKEEVRALRERLHKRKVGRNGMGAREERSFTQTPSTQGAPLRKGEEEKGKMEGGEVEEGEGGEVEAFSDETGETCGREESVGHMSPGVVSTVSPGLSSALSPDSSMASPDDNTPWKVSLKKGLKEGEEGFTNVQGRRRSLRLVEKKGPGEGQGGK